VDGFGAAIGMKGGRFFIKNDVSLSMKYGQQVVETMRAGSLSGNEEGGRRTCRYKGKKNLF